MLTNTQMRFWDENGYLLIPGLMPEDRRRLLNEHAEGIISGRIAAPWHPPGKKGILQSHLHDPFMMEMACYPPIPDALFDLIRGEPVLCQTMYFVHGTQSRVHQDEFFFRTKPPSIVGLWLALEDATVAQGALVAIPGSHKGRVVHREDVSGRWWIDPGVRDELSDKTEAIADMSKLIPLEAKAGDAIFFHGQLIHGGGKIASPELTRRSYVLHFHHIKSVLDPSNNKVELPPIRLR